MKSRDPSYLLDILSAARLIREFVADADRATFDKSLILQSAVMYQIGVIGEAAKRVSPDFRKQHPDIPWRDMAGMRDILVHGYDHVDLAEVWRVAIDAVPRLIKQFEPLVPKEGRAS